MSGAARREPALVDRPNSSFRNRELDESGRTARETGKTGDRARGAGWKRRDQAHGEGVKSRRRVRGEAYDSLPVTRGARIVVDDADHGVQMEIGRERIVVGENGRAALASRLEFPEVRMAVGRRTPRGGRRQENPRREAPPEAIHVRALLTLGAAFVGASAPIAAGRRKARR